MGGSEGRGRAARLACDPCGYRRLRAWEDRRIRPRGAALRRDDASRGRSAAGVRDRPDAARVAGGGAGGGGASCERLRLDLGEERGSRVPQGTGPDFRCRRSCPLEQVAVAAEVREAQVREARLSRAEQGAAAAQLEV